MLHRTHTYDGVLTQIQERDPEGRLEVILLGNKTDVDGEELVEASEANDLIESFKAGGGAIGEMYPSQFDVSARSEEQVEDAFMHGIYRVLKKQNDDAADAANGPADAAAIVAATAAAVAAARAAANGTAT